MRNNPHPESRWTHPICARCYADREPDRIPTYVKDDFAVPCCFCGKRTNDGIYYRKDPGEVHPV